MANPYILSFGKKPLEYVLRMANAYEVIEQFEDEARPCQAYMITGVRGAGKTVMLADISSYFEEKKNWVVVELSVETDLITELVASLYQQPGMKTAFAKAKISVKALGLEGALESTPPVSTRLSALKVMLEKLDKQNKNVLICIDEATKNKNVKEFASIFQMLLKKYPIYLVMTGLVENIDKLQDEKTLTFLYRAPRIVLEPLDLYEIKLKYMNTLKVSEEKATIMAKHTNGYAFAFQVLGHLTWKYRDKKTEEEILEEYDRYLFSYVYDKIWSELSNVDRQVVTSIALSEDNSVQAVRERIGMKPGTFSRYRERMKTRGLIDTSVYGEVTFVLPHFDKYVIRYSDFQ